MFHRADRQPTNWPRDGRMASADHYEDGPIATSPASGSAMTTSARSDGGLLIEGWPEDTLSRSDATCLFFSSSRASWAGAQDVLGHPHSAQSASRSRLLLRRA